MRAGKDGGRKETYARGMELRARVTLFAEGCRGSLSEASPSSCTTVHPSDGQL